MLFRPPAPPGGGGKAGRQNLTTFSVFFKIPLAIDFAGVTISSVPPYDDFGDWATPKEPTAELFLRPTSLSTPAFLPPSPIPLRPLLTSPIGESPALLHSS